MGLYKNTNGILTPVAGRGKAEYGASTVRTGAITASDSVAGGGALDKTVTFSTPMPDNDYIVVLDNVAAANFNVDVRNKTTSGFSLRIINTDDTGAHTFSGLYYTAFKLYTDNEYNSLLTNMKKLWENPNPSTSFAAQNIALSSSDYDVLLGVASVNESWGSKWHIQPMAVKGYNMVFNATSASANWSRMLSYQGPALYYAQDAYELSSVDNTKMIPLVIYGIKFNH